MSRVYKKEEAKQGGWQQVRDALQGFEGDVARIEEGQWGGQLVDDQGKPRPPRAYFEIETTNNVVHEATEDLSMDISERFSFRINMSEYAGSFWVDAFLESADKNKILLPDGLKGKRLVFKKVTLEGSEPKFNVTNFVIDRVVTKKTTAAPKVIVKAAPVAQPAPVIQVGGADEGDPMALALELAVGKTEAQFRSAISLHPKFVGSPFLPLAKAGQLTASFLKGGKLVEVQSGNQIIYQRP